MADPTPSAALAGISQDPAVIVEHIRDAAESEITHPDDECSVEAGGLHPHGALAAVAALEAVLALADDWDVPGEYLNDDMSDPNAPARECAADLRAVITSALTGTPQLSEDEEHG